MKSRALAFAAALLLVAEPAHAAEDDIDRARTFFNAGAQAYAAAKYADAVRSFEQAYALAPRPQVLFSLAQAEKKEFFDHGDVRLLRSAIQHYKDYLVQVESGGRRADALESKIDLEGRLARLDPHERMPLNGATDARKPRVTVYSATEGARASLDGGPLQELPYFADLEPGKHHVRVSSDGYFDAEQEVSGDRGIDVPVNLPLREKPALVLVKLASSADVFVDGRLTATAPVGRPIEVPAGVHVLSVVKNGKKAFSREVVLERGKEFRFEPKLETSGQRIVAWSMLGTGAMSLVIGGFAALVAIGSEAKAREIRVERNERNLSSDELVDHNRLIGQRNDARTAAIAFTSVGGALVLGGGLLYFLDRPDLAVLPPRSVEPNPPPKKPETPLDVTAGVKLRPYPLLGPGVYGAGLTATF